MLAVALVVMVIFLFLRPLAATVIPAAAVPLSLVGSFGAMYLLGFSLNNLTLMALTISTGFVVDDAIVMIENISRYIEQGETPLQAALKGSKQIGFTILSLTVSLIAVLIPLLFMSDVIGRLFREFAITVSITILISAFVSLTLTQLMCARFLHRTVLSDPAVENLSSFIGIDGTNTTLNSGRLLITLKPLSERNVSASEVIRRLEPALSNVRDIKLYMQPVQDLTIDNRVSR